MWVTHAQNKNKSSTNTSLMQTSVKTPKNQRAQSSMTFKKDRERKKIEWFIDFKVHWVILNTLQAGKFNKDPFTSKDTKQGSLTIQGMNKNNQQMNKHLN